MDVHVQTNWTAPKAYLRRGHIVTLWWHLLMLYRLAAWRRREQRELAHLQAHTKDMPDYLKRDIGLV